MKTKWTAADEKGFQKLLKRRRKVTAQVVKEYGISEETLNDWAEMMVEDRLTQDEWEKLLDWSSPEEMASDLEQFRDAPTEPARD